MRVAIVVVLLCLTSVYCQPRYQRQRERFDRTERNQWDHRPQQRDHRPQQRYPSRHDYDRFDNDNDQGPYYMPFQGFNPGNHQFQRPEHHMDHRPAETRPTPTPPPTPPPRPAPPSAPINTVLNTLNELPLSMYNNYICNMFTKEQQTEVVDTGFIRNKRAMFSRDFFRLRITFRNVVRNAYEALKPFASGSPYEIFRQIQEVAREAINSHGINLQDVLNAFISNQLQSDGISGNTTEVVSAISNLAATEPEQIEASTHEAVEQSCGAINTPFYCSYMRKLSASAGCSSQYFSSEMWILCCEGKFDTYQPEEVITETVIPAPALSTTQPPTTSSTTTKQPSTASTSKPTTSSTTTTSKPTTSSTTTTSKPTTSSTTTTSKPTTTSTTTTVAPTTSTTTPTPTTTAATKVCGVSNVNPATGFTDFSSAMNQVRIVGGVDTEKCEYPWMVRLQVGSSLCGGTIIDETHILTAGHCIGTNTASDITVHAGEYDYNVRDSVDVAHDVAAIDVHPQYTELDVGGVENDVAVLTLKEPLVYNDCVQPICLPNAGDGAAIEAGTQCVVAGWGTTSSGGQTANILQEVTVPTYSGDDCASGIFTSTIPTDSSLQLCAGRPVIGGADSCQGDSGGPLFCPVDGRYVQYGIVSYGAGCADAGAAGVYADTSAMLDFINTVKTA